MLQIFQFFSIFFNWNVLISINGTLFSIKQTIKKETRLKTLMNKKIRKVEKIKQNNIAETDGLDKKYKRTKKETRRRNQNKRNYSDLSLRSNDLKYLKNIDINNVERLKQTVLEFEEQYRTEKLTIKELGEISKNLPEEIRFESTEYLGKQREDNEIDLGFFRISKRLYTIKYEKTLPYKTLIN